MTHATAIADSWPLAIDRHSLSWQWGDHQHTVYFTSGSDEVSEDTLYRCEDLKHQTGFLFGSDSDRYSVVSRETSSGAELLHFIRAVANRTFAMMVPIKIINGELAEDNPIAQGLYVLNTALIWACVAVFGPVITVAEIALYSTFSEITTRALEKTGEASSLKNYFPLAKALPHMALGAVCCLPTAFVVNSAANLLVQAMLRLGFRFRPVQDAEDLIGAPGIGPLMALYCVIGAPLLEEILFRGILQDVFSPPPQKEKDPTSLGRIKEKVDAWIHGAKEKPEETKILGLTMAKWMTAIKVSVLFGLAHASIKQGWFNVPIVVATGLMGLAMAILREVTGDLWAPLALHALNNSIFVMQLYGILPTTCCELPQIS